MTDHTDTRSHWQTTLVTDHTDERPCRLETILMTHHTDERPCRLETILMTHHTDERPCRLETMLMTHHTDERPCRLETILMTHHTDERPCRLETMLMTHHTDERPCRLETMLMTHHTDERPCRLETILMTHHTDEGSYWWEELHLGDSNWKLFQVGYPVDTSTDMSFLLRVSVTHRPALARSILGRWKEQSLQMKPLSLPIVQGISRPTKGIRNTFWHNGIQCKNENKGEKPPSLETLQKKKGKSTKEAKGTHKSSIRMNWE